MFKRWWWVFLLTAMIGPVMGFLMAAVVTYVTPRTYESEAIIELKLTAPPGVNPPVVSPRFFETEFEKIKSRNSLGKVVDVLGLVNRWGLDKESAVRILKEIVNTENIRGTDLISIRVRHANKVDARDIAMEVANIYKGYRMDLEKRDFESAMTQVRRAVVDLEDKVEEFGKVVPLVERNAEKLLNDPVYRSHYYDQPDSAYVDRISPDEVIDLSFKLKRKQASEKDLLESVRRKQTEFEIASKTREDSVVTHQVPVIADHPVSPDVRRNLMLGTAGGFLISLLLAVPLRSFLDRSFRGGGLYPPCLA